MVIWISEIVLKLFVCVSDLFLMFDGVMKVWIFLVLFFLVFVVVVEIREVEVMLLF